MSTLGDVAGFAGDDLAIESDSAQSSGRIVLVEEAEVEWQRARCRDADQVFVPADRGLVGPTELQRWVWRRLLNRDGCPGAP